MEFDIPYALEIYTVILLVFFTRAGIVGNPSFAQKAIMVTFRYHTFSLRQVETVVAVLILQKSNP